MTTAELVAAVATTLGRDLSATEQSQVEMWIGDALMRIRLHYGDQFTQLDPAVVDYVVREAVALKVKQPDPLKALSVGVDDATTRREWFQSTGQVELGDWWDLLDSTLPEPVGSREAFSINTAPLLFRGPSWR